MCNRWMDLTKYRTKGFPITQRSLSLHIAGVCVFVCEVKNKQKSSIVIKVRTEVTFWRTVIIIKSFIFLSTVEDG